MVAQSSNTTISVPHDDERRPAIWPWLVMPAVVLLLFFTLERIHQRPHSAGAGTEAHPTAADPGDSSGR